ncbi:MAG: hypothetical protein IT297_11000 [Anaerolineae bacterium]|jgi:hypothetical protein|nr:hypothetical protein [Anaerolineae bacterium]MCZ7553534.1 hypothetical protein [Anaerolineales bacterium]
MTPELLSAIAAALLSLAASYLPGFAGWYEKLDSTAKRLTMLGLLAATAAAAYGLACAGYGERLGLALTCDAAGLETLIRSFGAALAANQSAYLITRPSKESQNGRRVPAGG